MRFRAARLDELTALTELCLRSKAHWGYDEDFMRACRAELSLTHEDIAETALVVADDNRGVIGVGQVSNDGTTAYLDKLFIEPYRMGEGCGVLLYEWSLQAARSLGARELVIEADPDAAAFYERMGAMRAGEAPSGSIPGRMLPRLVHALQEA